MPQIAQLAETYSSQVFWLLLIFGLVFLVVGRGMVPRVMDNVELRDRQIAEDLAAAQAARDQADKEEEAWRARENANRASAQALVGEAKAKSQAAAERRLTEVQARLDARLEEAEARIAASQAEAAASIEDVAAEAAQDITRRLAGIEVEPGAARQAVQGALVHG
jgi:F-type H+-transporting ATPase subunit b